MFVVTYWCDYDDPFDSENMRRPSVYIQESAARVEIVETLTMWHDVWGNVDGRRIVLEGDTWNLYNSLGDVSESIRLDTR